MRNAVLGVCVIFCFLLGCEPPAPEVTTVGSPANTLHLVPFACHYLGIEISELDGCSIACPGRVISSADLSTFTSDLICAHPSYPRALQCRVAQ